MEMVFWLILLPAVAVGITAWLFRMPDHGAVPHRLRTAWNRLLGQYHRFVQGQLLEPGEKERYRDRVLAVRAYSVDRQVILAHGAVCIVTDPRVMVENEQSCHVQLLTDNIRAIRAQRDYDPRDGFSHWVVMERVGSTLHEPEGDIALQCVNQEHTQALCAAIGSTTAVTPFT
jgi:hypothetical protein